MCQNAQQKKTPRYLGLCEIYNPRIHGYNSKTSHELFNHYIVFCSRNFKLCALEDDFYPSNNLDIYGDSDNDSDYYSETDSETDSENESNLNNTHIQNPSATILTNYAIINEFTYLKGTRNMCLTGYHAQELNIGKPLSRKYIRNYNNIIKSPKYLQPEIFEKVYIDDSCCAVIKTFWIKIVQRSWKRVFKERVRIMTLRKSIRSLMYWQMSGRWPENCAYMPGLHSMIKVNY